MGADQSPNPELVLSGELTLEQEQAVRDYVAAMNVMGEATMRLAEVGLDAGTALKAIPGEKEGETAFDALPPMLRMMLA